MRTVPSTLVSNMARHCSSSASATVAQPSAPPALFTSRRHSGTRATKASTEEGSVTSSGWPRPPISAARAAMRSARRAPTTTSQPSPASARAAAAPMPELAPVTTATGRVLRSSMALTVPTRG
jgi:hypothetical protein